MPSLINLRYFIFYPTGKDEKLRLRFDSSASERTLPRATARRARSDSDELSFPHHHSLKKHRNPITLRYSRFCPTGKDEKLRLRFDSSASERTLPRATVRRARSDSDELSFPHHHPLKKHLNPITLRYSIFCPTGKDEKLRPRFDSSASERTLPQATARRARRFSAELSFPLYSRALCNHLYCYLLARASLSEATSTVLLPPRSRFA